jgi:hypothetical protein
MCGVFSEFMVMIGTGVRRLLVYQVNTLHWSHFVDAHEALKSRLPSEDMEVRLYPSPLYVSINVDVLIYIAVCST